VSDSAMRYYDFTLPYCVVEVEACRTTDSRSIVLLKKYIISHLVKKLSAFYEKEKVHCRVHKSPTTGPYPQQI
jgi:hypothetical protein